MQHVWACSWWRQVSVTYHDDMQPLCFVGQRMVASPEFRRAIAAAQRDEVERIVQAAASTADSTDLGNISIS